MTTDLCDCNVEVFENNSLYNENVYELDGILQSFDNENSLNLVYRYILRYNNLPDDTRLKLQIKLDTVVDGLIDEANNALDSGYKIISLADPLSGMKFLGERGARIYIKKIFTDFLVRLKKLCEKYGGHIHICPRLSFLLYNYCELCIEFKNVSFSYDGKQDVLKNISFNVNKGETIAFVGSTGSGKSSIINLFLRFYEFERGKIFIDGIDIKDYSTKELRDKIGLVLQDPFLYHGTVESNIRMYKDNLTENDIEEAARFVDADNFIQELPEKYQSKVTERGSTFSSGQRQLITFARTIAAEPKILILDEATANIDSETEETIQRSLEKMRKGRTTIAIAHRLSTIQDANCIYVLDKGEIIEAGTHEQLLERKGTYYKMYQLQAGMMQ